MMKLCEHLKMCRGHELETSAALIALAPQSGFVEHQVIFRGEQRGEKATD